MHKHVGKRFDDISQEGFASKRPRISSQEIDKTVSGYFEQENRADFRAKMGTLFLFLFDELDLNNYNGVECERLLKVFTLLSMCLHYRSDPAYFAVRESLAEGEMPEEFFLRQDMGLLGPEPALFNRMVNIFIQNKKKPMSAEFFDGMFDEWRTFTGEAIKTLRRGPLMQYSFDQGVFETDLFSQRVEYVKTLFQDDPVKEDFFKIISNLPKEDPNYPSVSFCAPTGSGKTTFAQHLCCGEYPAIYLVFEPKKELRIEGVSIHFVEVSNLFEQVQTTDLLLLEDLGTLGNQNKSSRSVRKSNDAVKVKFDNVLLSEQESDCSCISFEPTNRLVLLEKWEDEEFKRDDLGVWYSMLNPGFASKVMGNELYCFKTVGFIVAVFRALKTAKQKEPHMTWLELQSKIEHFSFRAMTMNEGLEELQSSRGPDQSTPLILFLDDCSLSNKDKHGGMSLSRKRLLFTRFICSSLRILLVLIGPKVSDVDAKASSYCCEKHLPRAIIFNFMPSFDKHVLENRYAGLFERFAAFPRLLELGRFIMNPPRLELAHIVDIFLSTLETSPLERSPVDILETASSKCSKWLQLNDRKRKSGMFNRAQLAYIGAYTCETKSVLEDQIVRYGYLKDQTVVGNHVCHVGLFPSDSHSYCSIRDLDTLVHDSTEEFHYKIISKGIFKLFEDCPLTGLALFGLTSNHASFVDDEGDRIPVFKAVMNANITNHLSSLFRAAVIVSSRVNGLTGCGFLAFLRSLIQELSPYDRPVELHCTDDQFISEIDSIRIPIMAPMAESVWNDRLVDILKLIEPDCLLGVYLDNTAYIMDPGQPVFTSLSVSEAEKIQTVLAMNTMTPVASQPCLVNLSKLSHYPTKTVFSSKCINKCNTVKAYKIRQIVKEEFLQSSSNLFFLVAYEFAHKVSMDGAVFWYLRITEDYKFELVKLDVPKRRANEIHQRHVILLSLKTIWGNECTTYRDEFFAKEPDYWSLIFNLH